MSLRRIPILLSLLVCMFASAAETTTPPSAPVSDPPAADPPPKTDAKPPAEASKPAPSKPATESKGAKTPDGDFKPSEEISEDMAVAYPVDI